MENKEYFISEYANVYVDSYYLESYETIEYKNYYETNTSDISKELKGKYYELIYKEEKSGKISNIIKRSIPLILSSYLNPHLPVNRFCPR